LSIQIAKPFLLLLEEQKKKLGFLNLRGVQRTVFKEPFSKNHFQRMLSVKKSTKQIGQVVWKNKLLVVKTQTQQHHQIVLENPLKLLIPQ
jgi:hypothetical protein